MFEVKSRLPEAWGKLAEGSMPDDKFSNLINDRTANSTISKVKSVVKQQAKPRRYNVTFIRELVGDQFEVEAESDSEAGVCAAAHNLFKKIGGTVEFKMKPAGNYAGYDRICYVEI